MSKMTKQVKAMQAALTALKSIDAAMPFPVAKFAIHHLEEALAEALAEQPAPMSQPNRVIAYAAASKLRELGYEWMNDEWKHLDKLAEQPAQQDIPDLIAGTMGVSRGTAYDLMREALAKAHPQQERPSFVEWTTDYVQDNLHKLKPAPVQQEPVCIGWDDKTDTPIMGYTSPPAQRTWVGLTDEEITDIWAEASPYYHEDDFARAIEAKLRSKNEDRN